ncbi:hypothetical protein D3C84_1178160 [compost metagenome]
MNAFAIVEKYNITINFLVGLLFRSESWFAVDQFLFQNTVKGLHTGVVVTVAFPAHARFHSVLD